MNWIRSVLREFFLRRASKEVNKAYKIPNSPQALYLLKCSVYDLEHALKLKPDDEMREKINREIRMIETEIVKYE